MKEEDSDIEAQAVLPAEVTASENQSDDFFEADSRFSSTDGSSHYFSRQHSIEMLTRSGSATQEGGQIIAVVGEEHCSPCKRILFMARNVFKFGLSCDIDVKDEEGRIVYQVDRWGASPGQKRVIRDASGRSLLHMHCRTKWNDVWEAHRDESKTTEVFTMKPRSITQLSRKCKTSIKCATSENSEKEMFELKKAKHFSRNYTLLHGENVIAEIISKSNLWQTLQWKNKYSITTYPGVDTSFVVAMVVIVDATLARATTVTIFSALLSGLPNLITTILKLVSHTNKHKHN